MFSKIVCAVDGSPHAVKAAKMASELAVASDADLTFLTITKRLKLTEQVKHYLEVENLGSSEPQYLLDKFVKTVLEDARTVAKEIGAKATTETREGQPARMIVDFAQRSNCDAIVLGSRGHGDVEGAFLGSVSLQVTSLAKCTVITVK